MAHAMARFSHNSALWVLCLPCLAVLLAYGGLVSLIVLIFGAIVTYTADASDLREVTLVSVLATLLGVLVTLIVAARGMLGASGWNFLLLHQIVRPMHPCSDPYSALVLPSMRAEAQHIITPLPRHPRPTMPFAVHISPANHLYQALLRSIILLAPIVNNQFVNRKHR